MSPSRKKRTQRTCGDSNSIAGGAFGTSQEEALHEDGSSPSAQSLECSDPDLDDVESEADSPDKSDDGSLQDESDVEADQDADDDQDDADDQFGGDEQDDSEGQSGSDDQDEYEERASADEQNYDEDDVNSRRPGLRGRRQKRKFLPAVGVASVELRTKVQVLLDRLPEIESGAKAWHKSTRPMIETTPAIERMLPLPAATDIWTDKHRAGALKRWGAAASRRKLEHKLDRGGNREILTLYKSTLSLMRCFPEDIVGVTTYLAYDTSLNRIGGSTVWSGTFCEKLNALLPHIMWDGNPKSLAMAIRYVVVALRQDLGLWREHGQPELDDTYPNRIRQWIREHPELKTIQQVRAQIQAMGAKRGRGMWFHLFDAIEAAIGEGREEMKVTEQMRFRLIGPKHLDFLTEALNNMGVRAVGYPGMMPVEIGPFAVNRRRSTRAQPTAKSWRVVRTHACLREFLTLDRIVKEALHHDKSQHSGGHSEASEDDRGQDEPYSDDASSNQEEADNESDLDDDDDDRAQWNQDDFHHEPNIEDDSGSKSHAKPDSDDGSESDDAHPKSDTGNDSESDNGHPQSDLEDISESNNGHCKSSSHGDSETESDGNPKPVSEKKSSDSDDDVSGNQAEPEPSHDGASSGDETDFSGFSDHSGVSDHSGEEVHVISHVRYSAASPELPIKSEPGTPPEIDRTGSPAEVQVQVQSTMSPGRQDPPPSTSKRKRTGVASSPSLPHHKRRRDYIEDIEDPSQSELVPETPTGAGPVSGRSSPSDSGLDLPCGRRFRDEFYMGWL